MNNTKKKKLFTPIGLSGEKSRWIQWNKEQPIKDGKRINQYTDDGKKEGYWEEYRNGYLYSKGLYINDKKEGNWENYYSDGGLATKVPYKNDKMNGMWEQYFHEGQLRAKGLYKDGKEDGVWEHYFPNGDLYSRYLYDNGEVVEKLFMVETETPKKKLFAPIGLSGENSRWLKWNKEQPIKNGEPINQYTHDGKKTGYWEDYFDNGQLKSKGSYKNGIKDGIWEDYFYNGKLESKGSYKNGIKEGIWEYYWDNGQLGSKGSYKNGKLDGYWEDYGGNGKLESKGSYKNGEKEGIWEYYWDNGQLYSKGLYVNGKEDGIWMEYYNNGQLGSKGLYKNGKLVEKLPLTETKTPSFLLKEEMVLIREGNVQDYIENILSKIKNLPYETKKKYLTIAISTLLGYTSYPVIQSIIDKSPDKEAREITHRVLNQKDNLSMFNDGTKLHLSKKGLQHIVDEEKPKLIAYALSDGKITVGYGHAEPIGTTKLKVGQEITKEQAKQYLKQDLKVATDGVRRMFSEWKKQNKNYKVTQDMFDALVSLAFNMGVSGLRQSEMVRHLKSGDYKTAGQLIKQTNINPTKFPGLEGRRDKESNMFLSYLSQNNKINV